VRSLPLGQSIPRFLWKQPGLRWVCNRESTVQLKRSHRGYYDHVTERTQAAMIAVVMIAGVAMGGLAWATAWLSKNRSLQKICLLQYVRPNKATTAKPRIQ